MSNITLRFKGPFELRTEDIAADEARGIAAKTVGYLYFDFCDDDSPLTLLAEITGKNHLEVAGSAAKLLDKIYSRYLMENTTRHTFDDVCTGESVCYGIPF
jgi:hypothetical protein